MEKERLSVVFTGDIGFDRYFDGKWKDDALLDSGVLNFLHSADHVCANVEAAVTREGPDGDKGIFFHAMDPEAVCALKLMHADVWNLGNNHIMDGGAKGVADTLIHAEEAGAVTVGAGLNEKQASEPVILPGGGGAGIISVAYMNENVPAGPSSAGIVSWKDMDLIQSLIDRVKASCRWCVIVSHGGEEFTALPNTYTRDRYLRYLEMGADAVIAHHPHVPQGYEITGDGKVIFYSLGNFIFDTDYQRAHAHTDEGILVKLCFTKDELSFELLGTRIIRGDQRIVSAPLADIVTRIDAEQYALLAPLAARAHLAEERRRKEFQEPSRFIPMSPAEWKDFLFDKKNWPYRDDMSYQDFGYIYEFAKKAGEGEWKKSSLEKVKAYLLDLL